MEKEEELHLIHSLKSGDNQAYKYIYDHHYTLLCKIAYEFLKDDFLSETIVDDAIFHLWEIRETVNITTSLRSYLVQAVRNRCINYLNLEREKREVEPWQNRRKPWNVWRNWKTARKNPSVYRKRYV